MSERGEVREGERPEDVGSGKEGAKEGERERDRERGRREGESRY